MSSITEEDIEYMNCWTTEFVWLDWDEFEWDSNSTEGKCYKCWKIHNKDYVDWWEWDIIKCKKCNRIFE